MYVLTYLPVVINNPIKYYNLPFINRLHSSGTVKGRVKVNLHLFLFEAKLVLRA